MLVNGEYYQRINESTKSAHQRYRPICCRWSDDWMKMGRLILNFLFILVSGLFVLTCYKLSKVNVNIPDIALEIPDILPRPKKYLVIIPGYGGNKKRESMLRSSLEFYPSVDWDCLLFVYKPNISSQINLPCIAIESIGQYGNHLSNVNPEFVIRRKYSLIVVHLEDVIYQTPINFSWDSIYNFMLSANIDSLSPRVKQSHRPYYMDTKRNPTILSNQCPGLSPDQPCEWYGYNVSMIETFVQVYTPTAWICFWSMLDIKNNPFGWGYDICYKSICGVSLVVLDKWHLIHAGLNDIEADIDYKPAKIQMKSFLDERENFQGSDKILKRKCHHFQRK